MPDALERLQSGLAGRYTITRELGRGGMATVYLARDLRHEREVALKVLRPELGVALGSERFLQEIRLTASLSHPRILPLHDSGETDGLLYYVMPYVAGESLRGRLDRERQLPLEDALAIAREVSEALDHAHDHGVLHRDIKPENILLSGNGAVLADFGIARALEQAGAERLTETGLALGTPAYMSPEQAAGDKRLDARSDVYALGSVLYEMLAGELPYTGVTAQAIIAKRLSLPVPSVRVLRENVPAGVDLAIGRALSKVPADRFATAGAFTRALASPAAEPHRTPMRRWPLIATGLAATLAIAVWVLTHRDDTSGGPSRDVIAVFPFTPAATDTELTRLGRDLAVTVGIALDRVGGLRSVDQFSLLARTAADSRPLSAGEASRTAGRLGAGTAVIGGLARDGPDVRFDGALYVGDSAHAAASITARAPAGGIGPLSDSIAWAVLRQVWRTGAPPSPSLASVTTSSLPALRAFLDGEAELTRSRWPEAADLYRQALEHDGRFWLAYQRYHLARSWTESDVEPYILDSLDRHRDELSERDRPLVLVNLAVRADSAGRAATLLEQTARRYPEYWPAWFLYADNLTHGGAMRGHTSDEVRTAWRRVLDLNPSLLPAWGHLSQVSIGRDTLALADVIEALDRVGALSGPDPGSAHRGFLFRLYRQLGRTGGAVDSVAAALVDTMATFMGRAPADAPHREWATGATDYGYPAAQVAINRRVMSHPLDREVSAAYLRGTALSWAARGGWDSAVSMMARYAAVSSADDAPIETYEVAVLGAFLGALRPDQARQYRAAAHKAAARAGDRQYQAWAVELDAIVAFAEGNRQGVEAVGRALDSLPRRASGYDPVAYATRGVAALGQALGGDRAGAGRALAKLEWWCADSQRCYPAEMAAHRLLASRWLAEAGDEAEARRLLAVFEGLPASAMVRDVAILGGPGYLELARLEERRGASGVAAEYYRQFLRRYDAPVPSLIAMRDSARAALGRVGSPPGE